MSALRSSLFKPCIDLHNGQVKQIVGGTLSDAAPDALKTNFVASQSAGEFARIYRKHNLEGGHVIKLGAGNDDAALEALSAWPDALQIGGGITDQNAQYWIENHASKVIVTSFLFPNANFSLERLQALSNIVGKDRLVVDVSCRRRGDRWFVAMNKWQDITDMEVSKGMSICDTYLPVSKCSNIFLESLNMLSGYCSEFLVHAADVEGLCQGIDEDLVRRLGEWVTIPTTYAGGAKDISDLDLVDRLSNGKVDLTYGSALDIFGGSQVIFDDLVKENRIRQAKNRGSSA
ncbi:hypothetical protein CVT24_004030 [Panaeolus cyanescens]|uniref:1-(5-phosphoribosyl)-5-[(5-phosphoribosylamino)methylideneamino] imidazole-4-carboxamide isomerase n=1 Tax=Panaeolus cyanescens TaxID=181874 RepID=A0A409Y6E8_9AGAR|nr:hypothetical protein CVT24_004030 [Panaeolus cyanescens]